MLIQGLYCTCGRIVNDNVSLVTCIRCGVPLPQEIMAIKRMHHKEKMRNVELLSSGEVTMSEALAALPKITPT